MTELPDIEVYLDALRKRTHGKTLERTQILNPFVLRSVIPPVQALEGQAVQGLRRVGKRVVFEFREELFLVFHLMIAGRFHWLDRTKKTHPRGALVVLDFETGKLVLTEAGTKRRASLHVVQGEHALNRLDAGGRDVLAMDFPTFKAQLQRENHTLKRALTDPRLFSGIGNAYSDEILHAAKLSPISLTRDLSAEQMMSLLTAIQKTLANWTQRLLNEAGEGFPQHVTAFREGMAVHGCFGKPCPVCAAPVQRIVYSENETNYCARCQTGGKILADRALSRLLKKSWPRNIDDL
ncbi:MAG: formamidopyrimidine-DNA glycosylase [Betaproteobacteria bacterium]|nr:formamidopyrimidine-DNA glycosylase [Betaproteobacteria bacterium]